MRAAAGVPCARRLVIMLHAAAFIGGKVFASTIFSVALTHAGAAVLELDLRSR